MGLHPGLGSLGGSRRSAPSWRESDYHAMDLVTLVNTTILLVWPPPAGPAGRAALSKWGWFACTPFGMCPLPLYTPMQCDAVPSTGPFLRWKNHF